MAKTKTKARVLPKEVCVYWDGVDDENPYLIAASNFSEIADVHKHRDIGVYKLELCGTLMTRTEFVADPEPKKK